MRRRLRERREAPSSTGPSWPTGLLAELRRRQRERRRRKRGAASSEEAEGRRATYRVHIEPAPRATM